MTQIAKRPELLTKDILNARKLMSNLNGKIYNPKTRYYFLGVDSEYSKPEKSIKIKQKFALVECVEELQKMLQDHPYAIEVDGSEIYEKYSTTTIAIKSKCGAERFQDYFKMFVKNEDTAHNFIPASEKTYHRCEPIGRNTYTLSKSKKMKLANYISPYQ